MENYPLAIVTGAAQRLGRSFALRMAQHGYAILLHYMHSASAAAKIADEIRGMGIPVYTVKADLTDPAQIQLLFSTLDSLSFELKVLINSAAVMQRADLRTISVDEWDATMNLNLRAPVLLAQMSAARMNGGGLIVNISDAGSGKSWTSFPVYLASKTGLEMLTRMLAKTLAPTVRVNAIAPGLVLRSNELSMENWNKLVQRLPLKRPASEEDIIDALDFLLKNESVTGQTIVVDSGYSLL
jgi:NAD(P)-dependent dehydrogenase (short-subunit alcohol dehydrogenase family)